MFITNNSKKHAPCPRDNSPESFVSDFDVIYVDASSLSLVGFQLLFDKIQPYLKKYNKKIVVSSSALMELLKGPFSRFAEVIDTLSPHVPECVTIECDSQKSPSVENDLLSRMVKMRQVQSQVLVTENAALALEVQELGSSRSVKDIRSIQVARIGPNGTISWWNNRSAELTPHPLAEESDERIPSTRMPGFWKKRDGFYHTADSPGRFWHHS